MVKIQEDFPKIRDDADSNLASVVNYILALLNVKFTDDEQRYRDAQMLVLCDFLKDKFGQLTSEEIRNAFKMYVANEFPHLKLFRILDSIVLGEVLTAYVQYRNQHLHVHTQQKAALFLSDEISELEKVKIMDSAIVGCWEEFQKSGEIRSPFKHVFDELVSRGFIKTANENTPKLMQWYNERRLVAQAEVKRELRREKASNAYEAGALRKFKAEIQKISENNSSKVELKTIEIVLREFFQKQMELKKPVEDLLSCKSG